MNPIKVMVVEDEGPVRDSIRIRLAESNIPLEIISECDNCAQARDEIALLRPELVLLDVELPPETGFDLLRSLPDVFFEVIFVTGFKEYSIEAFQFNAVDYILKPLDKDKLEAALGRAAQRIESGRNSNQIQNLLRFLSEPNVQERSLTLLQSQGRELVVLKDIMYCQAEGERTHFFTYTKEKKIAKRNLGHYDKLLTKCGFFRIHHSYLVNLRWISEVSDDEGGKVILMDKQELPMSRRKGADLKRYLDDNEII